MKIFLFVAFCMGLDLVTFALIYPGKGVEMNPIMERGYAGFGLIIVGLIKVIATFAMCLLVLRVKNSRVRFWTAIFAASFGILGFLGNITAWLA